MHKLLHPSRRLLALLAIIAAAIPFALYVREVTPLVLTVLIQELLVQASYLFVCLLIGRPILRWLLPDKTDTTLGVVSAIALGLGIIGFATFALGHAGLISPTTAWGIIIGAAIIGLFDSKHFLASFTTGSRNLSKWLKQPSQGGLLWLVVALLFAIPLIGATLPVGMLWRPDDPHPYDSLIYHLQVPREWFELGRIVPLEHNVYSYFPFNVELHYLLASYLRGSPWLAATQNQFLSISFTLLAAAALHSFLRQRVDARNASLATAAFLAVPWVLMSSCVTYVEAGMLLYATLAIVWCLEALIQSARPYQNFILAGMFAGLVSGIKLTGAAMILAAVPACAIVCFALPAIRAGTGRLKQLLLGCILFGIAGTAALSPWLIRNQIWADNPVFPNAMRQLGQAHFSDIQVERWERAHRPAADHSSLPARLGRLTDQIAVNWRFSYIFFPLAIIAALCAWRKPEAWMLLLLLVIMLIFWLVATHLMGRFFVLALVPGAILIAMLPRQLFYPAAALVAASGIFIWIGPTFPAPQMVGTRNLHSLFAFYAEFGRNGAYGLQDYAIFDEKLHAKMESAKEIVFVGDGQMFHRQFPMDKIHYRTVFDLNQAGRNIVDTYYGPPPQSCPKDALIIADPGEANRLAKTYFAVPFFDPAALKDYPNTVTIEP